MSLQIGPIYKKHRTFGFNRNETSYLFGQEVKIKLPIYVFLNKP